MEFSSPCSGNYVKRKPQASKGKKGVVVFVPLFGELCKTTLRRLSFARVPHLVFVPLFGELCKTRVSVESSQEGFPCRFRPLVRGTM